LALQLFGALAVGDIPGNPNDAFLGVDFLVQRRGARFKTAGNAGDRQFVFNDFCLVRSGSCVERFLKTDPLSVLKNLMQKPALDIFR
jgi:hypothetical protein